MVFRIKNSGNQKFTFCSIFGTLNETKISEFPPYMYPDLSLEKLLAVWQFFLEKKICRPIFPVGFLLLMPIGLLAFPTSFPLSDTDRNSCIQLLADTDTTLYPQIQGNSPHQYFLYGNSQLLILLDNNSSQFLTSQQRHFFTHQAGACFLLAAQDWLEASQPDSSFMAIQGLLSLCWEIQSGTPSGPQVEASGSDWEDLYESISGYTRDQRLFPYTNAQLKALQKKTNQAISKIRASAAFKGLVLLGFSQLKKGRWDQNVWRLRKVMIMISSLLIREGRYEDAAIVLETGHKIFGPIDLPVIKLDFVLMERGLFNISGNMPQHYEAIQKYRELVRRFPMTGIWDNFGAIEGTKVLFGAGDFVASAQLTQEIESWATGYRPRIWELSLMIHIHQLLSYQWDLLGNLKKAREHILQADTFSQRLTEFPQRWTKYFHLISTASLKHQLAQIEFKLGKTEASFAAFEAANAELLLAEEEINQTPLPDFEKILLKQTIGGNTSELFAFPRATSMVNMGTLMGESGEAILGTRLIKEGLASGHLGKNSDIILKAWSNLAAISIRNQQDKDSIESYLNQTYKVLRANKLEGMLPFLWELHGEWSLQKGEIDSATYYFQSVIKSEDIALRRAAQLNLARLSLEEGNIEEAEKWLLDSLSLHLSEYDLGMMLSYSSLAGILLEKQGKDKSARNLYLQGWNLFLQSTERQVGSFSSKMLLDRVWPLAEGLCQYYLGTGQLDSVFFWQELIRTDFLNYLTARRNITIDHPQKGLIESLETELTLLNKQIQQQGRQPDLQLRKAELITRLEAVRMDEFQNYRPPLSPAHLQQQLQSGELLLEYAIIREKVWIILVTRDSLLIIPACDYHDLLEAIELLKSSLFTPPTQKTNSLLIAEEALNTLHKQLIDPIPDSILDSHPVLYIVPDGELYEVPFAALTDSKNLDTADSVSYLIHSHQLSYLPAANWLTRRLEHKSILPEEILLMAHSGKGHQSEDLDKQLNFFRDVGLALYTDEEVNAIAQHFQEKKPLVLIEEEITESWLLQADASGDLSRYDLIHFAGHVVIDPLFPSLSAILIEPDEETFSDGRFTVYDFSTLSLGTDLIVLSGCHSSGGKALRGVGRMGFLHALAGSGAQHQVLSQWNVEDQPTATLFPPFYQSLSEGETPAASMRRAQIQLADQQLPPYYWAAFQVFGADPLR